jgi:hypothetical protein
MIPRLPRPRHPPSPSADDSGASSSFAAAPVEIPDDAADDSAAAAAAAADAVVTRQFFPAPAAALGLAPPVRHGPAAARLQRRDGLLRRRGVQEEPARAAVVHFGAEGKRNERRLHLWSSVQNHREKGMRPYACDQLRCGCWLGSALGRVVGKV